MSLNLLNSNGIPQDAARADAPRASRRPGHAEVNAQQPSEKPADTVGDRVELAPASPSRPDPTEGSVPPRGTLSAERLREIAARLESDYYDRPEVVDCMARRLLPDLHSQE